MLRAQGKFTEAKNFLDSICAVKECDHDCNYWKFNINLSLGDIEQAERYYRLFIEVGGIPNVFDSISRAYLYKESGNEKEALSIFNRSRKSLEIQLSENKTWWLYFNLSRIHAILMRKLWLSNYLSKAAQLGFYEGYNDYLLFDPAFKNLRDDPEFITIIKQIHEEKETSPGIG